MCLSRRSTNLNIYCKAKIVFVILAAVFAAAALGGCGGMIESPDIAPHFFETTGERALAIDDYETARLSETAGALTDAQFRTRVDELYNVVVYDRKKPIFRDNDPVEPIYVAARDMLMRYGHGDLQGESREVSVAHTVHDWLIYNVAYDFELYNSYLESKIEPENSPAFHIDGVLTNKRAVCDGLARAFDFLCAMEGLRTVRVTGTFSSVPHAWNKVRIGGEWYNIDVTADAANYSVNGKKNKQIAHGFMLLGDDTMRNFAPIVHDFTEAEPKAPRDYGRIIDEYIEIGGKTYARTVRSQTELNAVFAAVSSARGEIGKIELKLEFAGKTQVNGADMYLSEIAEAYKKVKTPGFEISKRSKPYFEYPNGVYLFLVYR